jgi:hypothetical protein
MFVVNYYSVKGRLLAEKSLGESRRDFLADPLGAITSTVTTAAQVENTYRYKPYGRLLNKTGAAGNPSFLWGGPYENSPEHNCADATLLDELVKMLCVRMFPDVTKREGQSSATAA